MFAAASRRPASTETPASAAPRSSAVPPSAITPNTGGRPANSSRPSTICQRVATQPIALSSAGDTSNSVPAAWNTESNGDGRATGAARSAEIPATRGAGQDSTGASWQAATKTMSAGLSRVVMGGAVCQPPHAPAL